MLDGGEVGLQDTSLGWAAAVELKQRPGFSCGALSEGCAGLGFPGFAGALGRRGRLQWGQLVQGGEE